MPHKPKSKLKPSKIEMSNTMFLPDNKHFFLSADWSREYRAWK